MSRAVSVFGIPARSAQRSGTRARLRVPAAVFSAGHPGSLGCPPGPGPPQGFIPKDFAFSSALFVD